MAEIRANGVRLHVDAFGSSSDPALLMISGLGSQSIGYDDGLCERLAATGRHVIRFDNRDCGRSQKFDDAGSDIWSALSSIAEGDTSVVAYQLEDMARDAVGVLDAFDHDRAIVWGCSMGGMIAQELAIRWPDRVSGLVSIMSTTGEPHVGQPRADVLVGLLASASPAATPHDAIERGVEQARLVGSPELVDEAYVRARQTRMVERGLYPQGTARQLLAVMASPHRGDRLASVTAPTMVIHGRVDPVIDISGGERTAELVDGATMVALDHMGHDLPPVLWPTFVTAVERVAAAERSGGSTAGHGESHSLGRASAA